MNNVIAVIMSLLITSFPVFPITFLIACNLRKVIALIKIFKSVARVICSFYTTKIEYSELKYHHRFCIILRIILILCLYDKWADYSIT